MESHTKLAVMYGFYFHKYPEESQIKKLHRQWSGPFTVVKCLSNVTYRVQDINNRCKRMVVHFNRLKPYKQRVQTPLKDKAKDKPSLQDNTQPTHHFGTELELVDDKGEGNITLPDPPQDGRADTEPNVEQEDPQYESELVRRYPRRVHHPPDFYS